MSFKDWLLGSGKSKNDTNGVWGHRESTQYGDDYVHPTQTYYAPETKPAKAPQPKGISSPKAPLGESKTKSSDTINKPSPEPLEFDEVKFPPLQEGAKIVTGTTTGGKQIPKAAGAPYVHNPLPVNAPYKAPPIQQKEVIAFIVENSDEVFKYKNDVLRILNNIIESKKSALFLFVRIGNCGEFYELMEHSDVTYYDFTADLLTDSNSKEKVSLTEAMFHVKSVFKKQLLPNFTFKNVPYNLSSCSVICIGSSITEQDNFEKKVTMSCIDDFKELKKLKGIKYFCVKDSDAVYAASLGFPTIGHIISNYYE